MSEKRVTVRQRRAIATRAKNCCEYCLSPANFTTDPFAVEHIAPVYHGGKTTLDNLALSCTGCNGHKSTKLEALDPVSNKVVPLYHPRKQRWQEHFSWNEDTTLIFGLTPTGRATIDALQLNRPEVVNLRRVLRLSREYPPTQLEDAETPERG
jgi:5-methylcytosine-specific restriction endonuclease McrA